jgi:predicted anti-sigma-YlaC factor YlaD
MTNRHEGRAELAPCVSTEQLAAYIDRQSLSLTERARIDQHLSRCRACRQIVATVIRLQIESEQ